MPNLIFVGVAQVGIVDDHLYNVAIPPIGRAVEFGTDGQAVRRGERSTIACGIADAIDPELRACPIV
jgi:hypothetical protein